MKQELKTHLIPLGLIFVAVSLSWIFKHTVWYQYIYLFFGFLWGSFFLDIDHLIYWFYLNPNLEESRLAQAAFKKNDMVSVLKLLESTHERHNSMIFHHFFAQVVLVLISVFVFTSTAGIFTKAFVLALNLHLLIDEIKDYRTKPKHLQEWLFAREEKQLPIRFLKYYLSIFVFLNFIFFLVLLTSNS